MEYSLGISDFLEEISSLSHSVVFFYFFALSIEEGLLIFPCYSLERRKTLLQIQAGEKCMESVTELLCENYRAYRNIMSVR